MRRTDKIIIAVILVAVMLLSVGYAAIENITLNIGGTVSADPIQANVLTAADITADDYGGVVTNYASEASAEQSSVNWKIFHSDGENIYLIADDYIETQYAPAGKGNMPVETDSTYTRGFSLSPSADYAGTADILSNIKTKLLTQYTYTSTNENAKATAYLLDTNQWGTFANSSYADYAIGVPTLELFTASYNKKYPTNTIETQANETGYQIKWSTDESFANYITGLSTSDSLYVISDSSNAFGMWFASPAADSTYSVMNVDCDCYVDRYAYDATNYGARPIVSLKSSVKIQKQEDGTYKIVE